jgi:hypothetical protein
VRTLNHVGVEALVAVSDIRALMDAVESKAPDAVVLDVRLPPTFTDGASRPRRSCTVACVTATTMWNSASKGDHSPVSGRRHRNSTGRDDTSLGSVCVDALAIAVELIRLHDRVELVLDQDPHDPSVGPARRDEQVILATSSGLGPNVVVVADLHHRFEWRAVRNRTDQHGMLHEPASEVVVAAQLLRE